VYVVLFLLWATWMIERHVKKELNLILVLLFQDVFRMSNNGEDHKKRTQQQETNCKQVTTKDPMLIDYSKETEGG
jgi:hypothetical protein